MEKISTMKLTLHKLPEGYIITSDELFEIGDPLYDFRDNVYRTCKQSHFPNGLRVLDEWTKKVIAIKNQIDFSALSEEEQREIGWFDVKKLAKQEIEGVDTKDVMCRLGFEWGFKKAQELQSDRMFTLKDISKAMKYASEITNNKMKYMENYIESLSQPKSWKIEVEMEKYCSTGRVCDGKGKNCHNAILEPKFTDGKLKILKLL